MHKSLKLAGIVGLCLVLALASMAATKAQEQTDSVLTVHVVQRGENLFRIALQYDLFANEVAKANGITDSDGIVVGQRLIIPLIYNMPDLPLTHTVVAGETIYSIATSYGIEVEELLTFSGLDENDDIYVGQSLVIVPADDSAALSTSPDAEDGSTTTSADDTQDSLPAPVRGNGIIIGDPDFAFVHTVEAGDTVFDLGLRYNLTVSALSQANNLIDPTKIYVGQRLIVPGIEPPRLAQDLPANVSAFTIHPLIFEEGRTGRIEIRTTESANLSGTFLDQELQVIEQEDGLQHNIIVGIPMFTQQDVYPLRLTLSGDDGVVVPINANLQVIGGGYGYQNITIGNSELLSEAIEVTEKNLLVGTTQHFNPAKYWEDSIGLPAAAPMNAFFGALRSYNGSAYDRYHHGVDFAGPSGTPVLAAADGTVVLADALRIRGNAIIVDHGWGLYTLYAHLNSMLVSPGEQITSGQKIGTIGSTGRSTGPHLHWEVWLNGVNVDPQQWVQETFP